MDVLDIRDYPKEIIDSTIYTGIAGSGKSYSMLGTGGEMSKRIVSEQRGLIPRICEALFNDKYLVLLKLNLYRVYFNMLIMSIVMQFYIMKF